MWCGVVWCGDYSGGVITMVVMWGGVMTIVVV